MEWYRLRCVGVKDKNIRKLMENFKNYREIFNSLDRSLEDIFLYEKEEIEKIRKSQDIDLSGELDILKSQGVKILSLKDEEYPKELKMIASPPIFLYYVGDIKLLKERKIGVVGTRKVSAYGELACEKITTELVENGVVTVSGLALGVDSICHRKTLEIGGKTIAVVGSGLDKIYPKENRKLWNKIGERGLILSEYPLGTEPLNRNFPMRNRIIAGLSQGIVVVESYERGGSLITADFALEENREVFAIPGEIFSRTSFGTNELIKNSLAKLITCGADIFEELGWNVVKKDKKYIEKNLNLTEDEARIYNILSKERNLDEIILEAKMKAGDILSILMDLEMKKLIMSVAGGKYRRKN